jgi:tetratricopeptide (TPR) repeat protein
MFRGSQVWGLGLALWFTGCAAAQASPTSQKAFPTQFSELAQRASEAFNHNRLEDAAELYRQAVKLHPDWAEGWGYLAASLYSLHKFAPAREAYRRTTILTPKNGPSWAYLGFCEYELRDYRPAFDHLIKSQRLGLGESGELAAKVHYELGLLWDTAGKFEMGSKELSALANMGDQNQGEKNPQAVEATGLNVLRMPLFPYEIPAAKHDLVMKAGEAGWAANTHHLEDSRKLYQEAITAYPTAPNLHFAYGFVLAALDQEAAVAALEKELEITPAHVPAMIEAAFLSLEMGQLDKSERLARRAMVLEPKNYAPHNILGRILMQTGHEAQGIEELQTAVRLAPSVPAAHFNLAQAYQKTGKSMAAAREFAEFKELNRKEEGPDAGSPANR